MTLKSIKFIDALGQTFDFELNADEGIYSLVLVTGAKRGFKSLVVNGETEVYHMRPKDIIAIAVAYQ